MNEWRGKLGLEIHELRQEAERLRAFDPFASIEPSLRATMLAGQQEVTFHFFVVCVGRIERFLPIAARAAGHRIPQADRDLLAPYRLLRDYYEHLENRLPVGTHHAEVVTEEERDGEWRVRMEIPVDSQGRFVFDGKIVDVTTRGMTAVEGVLQRHWDQLRVSVLDLVRKHFKDNPTDIPSPAEVKQELLVSTGGI